MGAGTKYIRIVVFFCVLLFSGWCTKKQANMISYDILMHFFRLGEFIQTDCGSCRVDPKIHHPGKRPLAMCEHTRGALGDYALAFRRKICLEHSPIGRRNYYLMTDAANSLSDAASPELAKPGTSIANLASD